jgi:hypothetical protein
MGLYKGGAANTWTIFCVCNKQVGHKQVTHKQENKHVLFNNTALWFTLSAIKTMTMFLNIVLCYIKRQCPCWITYVVGTGLIFGGLIINLGGLYSGGLIFGGGGGLIFGTRWALVYVVGLYIRGGAYIRGGGGLIVGGLRYGNFFDHCNIFVNRWSEFLLISIKISKIRKKAEHTFETDIFSCVVWKCEKNLLKPAEEQLVWFRIGSKRWLQVFRSWNAVKWPCWPVGTFYWVNIKWCVEWNEMKFRFNVTDRVGMVWIQMILVNYVMMMHGLWWCW